MFPPTEEIPATEISASLASPVKPTAATVAAALSPPASAIDQLNLNANAASASSQPSNHLNLDAMMGEDEAIYRSPRRPVRTFALDFKDAKLNNKSIDELVEVKREQIEEAKGSSPEDEFQATATAAKQPAQGNPTESKTEAPKTSPEMSVVQQAISMLKESSAIVIEDAELSKNPAPLQAFDSPITAKHKSDEDLSSQQPSVKKAALFSEPAAAAIESDHEEREVLSQNIVVDNDEGYQSQPVHFSTQADEESPVKQQPQPLLVKTLSAEFEQKIASISVSPQKSPTKTRCTMSPVRIPAEPEEAVAKSPQLSLPQPVVAAAVASPQRVDEKTARQIEFLQYEIHSLQEKYENSLQTNAEMRSMLTEYERTLSQFIDARRTRPDQHSSVDELLRDKKKLELEIQTLQISFQNLHQRYEDIKGLCEQARINEATLKQSVQMLQQELGASMRNLDSTRKSYEERIEKLNMESLNLKASLENELSVTKAKLLKSELKISSLEASIEAKTRENNELMTICDELIHKMDRKS